MIPKVHQIESTLGSSEVAIVVPRPFWSVVFLKALVDVPEVRSYEEEEPGAPLTFRVTFDNLQPPPLR